MITIEQWYTFTLPGGRVLHFRAASPDEAYSQLMQFLREEHESDLAPISASSAHS